MRNRLTVARLIGSVLLFVGSSFLSVTLLALWNPWDAVWWVPMVGLGLLVIGGMLRGGANLVESDQENHRYLYEVENVEQGFDPDE